VEQSTLNTYKPPHPCYCFFFFFFFFFFFAGIS